MRYAPIASGLVRAANPLRPDYTDANIVANAPFKQARFIPIGDYQAYNPIDTQRYINAANAQAAATNNAVVNSGGNRGSVLAGLAANAYNNQLGLSQIMAQAEVMNQDQRMKVGEFNRGTNQFNSQGDSQVSQFNGQSIRH